MVSGKGSDDWRVGRGFRALRNLHFRDWVLAIHFDSWLKITIALGCKRFIGREQGIRCCRSRCQEWIYEIQTRSSDHFGNRGGRHVGLGRLDFGTGRGCQPKFPASKA